MTPQPDQSRLLLVGNSSYANRGCEAIVRGTAIILRAAFGERITFAQGIYAGEPDVEQQNAAERDPGVTTFPLSRSVPRWSRTWFEERSNRHLGTHLPGVHRPLLPHLDTTPCALEIGGDHYTLDYTLPTHYFAMDRFLQSRGLPVILWGASVGPFDKNPGFATLAFEHLRRLDAVFVRETASLDYLKAHNVSDNVHLVADPAFLMPPSEPACAPAIPDQTIGLNFSPLYGKYLLSTDKPIWELTAEDLEPWRKTCTELVVATAKQTGLPITLIPHVSSTLPGVDDQSFLESVARFAEPLSPVQIRCLPRGLNAQELKWIIARCRIFAGARTHATIAAISSGVPTLSLGYSMKARGINQDVFGSQRFCIPASDLSADTFLGRLADLLAEENAIRARLADVVPALKERSLSAGLILRNLLASRTES